jgi:hypothetical protein
MRTDQIHSPRSPSGPFATIQTMTVVDPAR